MNTKNIIIGLDGATWEIIDYFADLSIMPNLKALKERGCYGNLKSTIVPITPSAWASMMTGCRPPKTGVFHFTKSFGKENTYLKILVNGNDIKVPTMWEILSSYGRDVISINVPMTFPPRAVNGIMISCMMTPEGEPNFTYPENLKDELAENGINYKIDTSLHRNRDKLPDEDFVKRLFNNGAKDFFDELNELLDIRKKTIRYLMENKKWQYFMFVLIGIDRIQHHFWDYIKDSSIDYRVTKNIRDYYRRVDEFIGELCSEFLDLSNIFIVSDHGFAKFNGDFVIDAWLLKKGYLKTKGTELSSWKTQLKKILKSSGVDVRKAAGYFLNKEKINKLQLSASNIDWRHTLAYGASINGININLQGRESLGCVEPNKYDHVRDKIISDLENIVDPNGFRIFKEIYKKEKVYSEGELDLIPDIILEFDNNVLYRGINTQHISEDTGLFRSYPWLSGNHTRNGIFIAAGKQIKSLGHIHDTNIEDFLPTLLAINGENIPRHLEGKVIGDIINGEAEISYIDFDYAKTDREYQYTEDGEEGLKEKLKSLGYI